MGEEKPQKGKLFRLRLHQRCCSFLRLFVVPARGEKVNGIHGGEEKIYMSSADFMTRNLSYRVETTFPIYDPVIHQKVMTIINLQLADNTKARLLSDQQGNSYRGGGSIRRQSQEETYLYLKRQLVQMREAEEEEPHS